MVPLLNQCHAFVITFLRGQMKTENSQEKYLNKAFAVLELT